MQFNKDNDRLVAQAPPSSCRSARRPWGRFLACLAVVAALTGAFLPSQQPPPRDPFKPLLPPDATPIPDANAQMQMRDQQGKKQNFAAANAERKKAIADESALLLKLATDLKTEVDKTNQDTLSLSVIRKADAIEKLAHDVKEKMKITVGAS